MNDDLAREMITELRRIAETLEKMLPEPVQTRIVTAEELDPELGNQSNIPYD